MRKILQYILKILAQLVLWKYKPIIVGVTGSVGKTSTKEAIYTVLRNKFKVRRNLRNYNNEIGVPLTILGLETGNRSVWAWLKNFCSAGKMIFWRINYPQILILEMGADKPGDIKYLVSFIPVDVGLVTAIGEFPVHLEFFPEKGKLIEEKANLIKYLPADGLAVLNYDDLSVRMMREQVPLGAKMITYGFGSGADLRILNFEFRGESESPKSTFFGISFKLEYQGSIVPVRMNQVLGKQQTYAAAAAAAVGLNFGLNLIEISKALKDTQVLAGRGKIIKGVKQTWIIDDTYNASPSSTLAALEVLEQFVGQRKIAVLGDMLELGPNTEVGHRQVGQQAALVVDLLLVVGSRAKFIADEFRKQSQKEWIRQAHHRVFEFDQAEEAGLALQKLLQTGDIILVKGSRSMRMEKVVEEIKGTVPGTAS